MGIEKTIRETELSKDFEGEDIEYTQYLNTIEMALETVAELNDIRSLATYDDPLEDEQKKAITEFKSYVDYLLSNTFVYEKKTTLKQEKAKELINALNESFETLIFETQLDYNPFEVSLREVQCNLIKMKKYIT